MFKKTGSFVGHFKRNGVVAFASLVVDFSVFILLKPAIGGLQALVFGYCSGLIVNYILSSVWAFNQRRFKNELAQFVIFTLGAMSGLAIELIIFSIANTILPAPIARIVSIGMAFVWNFALKELFIFSKPRSIRLRQVLGAYENLTLSELLYISIRWLTCPIERILVHVPSKGRVYEYGSGSGINLVVASLMHPNLMLYGSDIDTRKLKLSHKIKLPNVSTSTSLPKQTTDTFLIVDVLYLLAESEQQKLITTATQLLKPKAKLVIKEMSRTPKWKHYWNVIQEHMSVKVTGLTRSTTSTIHVLSVEDIRQWAIRNGFNAHTFRIDRRYPHPHAVVVIDSPVDSSNKTT